ncbi:hypothetical protein [Helicobacter equorum]|uniref:hypothetical protein n=1 Tax=Helicobacter equorum TaxID=361872 RepID=UPI000CF1389D|nr:hypothetical protein [Helicobacter equorum]
MSVYQDVANTIYPKVKALLAQGKFKTITFDSVKFAVDRGIEYAVKNYTRDGGGIIGSVGEFLGHDLEKGAVMEALDGNLISSNAEFVKAFTEISKAQREALHKATPPPAMQNFDPMSAYTNLAKGENYTRGGAGDYSHFDPIQAKDPSKTPQVASKISDSIFGRNGRFLGGGFMYNDTPKSLHSSKEFNLQNHNYAQDQRYMFQTQLHAFEYRILPRINEVLHHLSVYFCISYTQKVDKSKISRWLKKTFTGREYHLTEQDNKNRRDFLIQLTLQEANYYLTRIDKFMFGDQVSDYLVRYNYGEDKGFLDKKIRYVLNQSDFLDSNPQEVAKANALLMEQETNELLNYMKNPMLVEAQIQSKHAEVSKYINNPYEMGILYALRAIDAHKQTLQDSQNKDLDISQKLINYIQSNTLPLIRSYGENSVFRFLNVSDTTSYKAKNPNYKTPSLDCFTKLPTIPSDELLDKIEELKELSPLYFTYAQIEDHKYLLEYVKDPEVIKSYKTLYGENLEYSSVFADIEV